jgi:hypothetical protein
LPVDSYPGSQKVFQKHIELIAAVQATLNQEFHDNIAPDRATQIKQD